MRVNNTSEILVGGVYFGISSRRKVVVLASYTHKHAAWVTLAMEGMEPECISATVFMDLYELPDHSLKRGDVFTIPGLYSSVFLYIGDDLVNEFRKGSVTGRWNLTSETLKGILSGMNADYFDIEKVGKISLG